MTKKVFSLIIFLLFLIKSYGQQFYVSTNQGSLILVTLTPNGQTMQQVSGCGGNSFYSIAAAGNKIYYTTPGELYVADITTGNSPATGNCKLISTGGGNALTVDGNGVLYFASGTELYSIDANNAKYTNLGTMPYSSGGDLAFYNGSLFMAAPEGIVKVQIGNPPQSKLYIPISGHSIFGLASAAVNGTNIMYAFASNGDIIQLDMENKVVKSIVGSIPYGVNDAAGVALFNETPTIQADIVNITRECDMFNKTHAVVLCEPHTSQYTYTLNTGQANTTGIFDGLAPGAYTVNITASDGETPVAMNFNIPDYTVNNPVITVTKTNPVCNLPGKITLNADATGSNYKIQYNNATFNFGYTFAGLKAGTYHFTVLNQDGCIADEEDCTLVQDICPPIVVTNIQIQPECSAYGQASVKVFTQTPPYNTIYTFTLNNVSNTTGVFDFVAPGAYTLYIVSNGGNTYQQPVTVPDFTINKQNISYHVKNAVCNLAGEVIFSATDIDTSFYKISYGADKYKFNQVIKNLSPGINQFQFSNNVGCVVDTINVNVLQDKCDPVVFPNTFTPNGDGINDIFRPNQDANPDSYKVIIYNRWGIQMFRSGVVTNGWDGKYNGKPVSFGVYYWIATFTMPGEEKKTITGYVTLIR